MGRPRLGAHLEQILLQFRQPRVVGVGLGQPDRRLGRLGRGHVRENDHHQPFERPGFIKLLDGHIHALLPAIGPDLESVERHSALLLERFMESTGQFVAEAFAGHGEDVPVGLAGGRFQVFAGVAANVKDVALVIDERGGRGITLQDQLIRQRLEASRRFR